MYLRLSVTGRCNYFCRYCRTPVSPDERTGPNPLKGFELVGLVQRLHRVVPLHKVRITGGEPLLRSDLTSIVGALRAALPAAELALTTNAHRLVDVAGELQKVGLDRINISLDSTLEEQFLRVTAVRGLTRVRAGFSAALDAGFPPPKINTVLLRTVAGQELRRLLSFASERGSELRFIELMPFGLADGFFEREFMSAEEARDRLSRYAECRRALDATGTAERYVYSFEGRDVVVGFISSVSRPFCDRCDRLRLDSHGRLRLCLRRSLELDMVELRKRSPQEGARRLRAALACKPGVVRDWPDLSMAAIGG